LNMFKKMRNVEHSITGLSIMTCQIAQKFKQSVMQWVKMLLNETGTKINDIYLNDIAAISETW
jgi:hypothetical protein